MNKLNNRILLITFEFHPLNSPRSIRWKNLTKYFCEHGYQIDVLTSKVYSGEGYKYFSKNNLGHFIRVVQSGINFRNSDHIHKQNKNKTKRSMILELLRKIRWPDYSFHWIPFAFFRALILILKEPYKIIITSSHPFSSHFIGLLISYFYRKTWLVDVGDPFSTLHGIKVNNDKLYKKFNFYIEKKIYNRCNYITVTLDKMKKEIEEIFDVDLHKIYIMPPIISPKMGEIKHSQEFHNNIKVFFLGTLYSEIRDPGFALDLFKMVNNTLRNRKVEIHIFGKIVDNTGKIMDKINSNQYVFFHGLINHDDIPEIISECDFLLNIGNSSPNQLPSKTVEYLTFQKPILNLAESELDTSIEIYKGYSFCLNIIKTKFLESIVNSLTEFLLNPPKVSQNEINKIIKTYELETIGNKYLELLKN